MGVGLLRVGVHGRDVVDLGGACQRLLIECQGLLTEYHAVPPPAIDEEPLGSRCAGGGPLLAGAQVLRHSTARRGMVAVVADGRQGGDPCFLGSTAVPKRDWVAALGTAARVKAAPAVDAVAVALEALVHLARGQLEAHWAHQGRHQIECHLRHRL